MDRRIAGDLGVCVFLTMLAVHLGLSSLGFRRTTGILRFVMRSRSPKRREATAPIEAIVTTVQRVGAAFPGRAKCLEQSLTLLAVLRWFGVPAVMRLGVQPFPFAAHAWVEVDGRRLGSMEEWYCDFHAFSFTI